MLHLDGTAHRVDNAREFYQQAVAGGLDDAAAMNVDFWVNQLRGRTRHSCITYSIISSALARSNGAIVRRAFR